MIVQSNGERGWSSASFRVVAHAPIPSCLAEFSGTPPYLSLSVSTFSFVRPRWDFQLLHSCGSIVVIKWGAYLLMHCFFLSCKAWTATAVVVGMLSIATSNCEPSRLFVEKPEFPWLIGFCNTIVLILLRLWVLWDRSPRLVLGTLGFFVVTQIVALSLTGYVIHEMLRTCICVCLHLFSWDHDVVQCSIHRASSNTVR